MSNEKKELFSPVDSHAHPDGRRCCGRLLSEKCTPEEEAVNTNSKTGEKTCCKHKNTHNH